MTPVVFKKKAEQALGKHLLATEDGFDDAVLEVIQLAREIRDQALEEAARLIGCKGEQCDLVNSYCSGCDWASEILYLKASSKSPLEPEKEKGGT